ncbi:hypothetical protein [Terrarubrum flagellatum]|uniref:hypothetical protein n=1 Tax=Terrirubrum flagellatum TaxID=2895980 RepID=UPI0031453E31
MEEVAPTMANTRRMSFAIFWKFWLAFEIAGFALGFISALLPWGQLQFWLIAMLARFLPSTAAEALFSSPRAIEVALGVLFHIAAALFGFLLLNALLARHVGRRFGRWRLVAARAEDGN